MHCRPKKLRKRNVSLRQVVRYLLVMAIPVLASVLLFYASLPIRADAHRLSSEVLNLALSPNELNRKLAYASLLNNEDMSPFRWIWCLAISTVLFTGMCCALVVSPDLSSEKKLNLLTAMVIGLCAANLVVGFGFLNWLDFGVAAATATIFAGSIVWLRTSMKRKRAG